MDLRQGGNPPLLDLPYKLNDAHTCLWHQQNVLPIFAANFTDHAVYDECGKCLHIVSGTRTSSTNTCPSQAACTDIGYRNENAGADLKG
jgi:hypothetical protein